MTTFDRRFLYMQHLGYFYCLLGMMLLTGNVAQEKNNLKEQEKKFTTILESVGDRQYSLAIELLKELVQEYPESPDRDYWALHLIRIYGYLKQDEFFLQAVQSFESSFPHSPYLPKVKLLQAEHEWASGKKDLLIQVYLERLTALTSASYQEWLTRYDYQQGVQAFQKKDFTKAVQHFSNILALLPPETASDFYYYFAMSLFEESLGLNATEMLHYHKRIETILEVQLSLPQTPKASFHFLKGKLLLRKKEWEQAQEAFFKFLELRKVNPEIQDHPTLAHGWLELGNSFLEQGNLKESVPCYQKAIELAPALDQEIIELLIEAAFRREQYALLLDLANQFSHLHSENIIYYTGVACQKLGRITEAEKLFGEFLGKFPNHYLWQEVRDRIPNMIYERIQDSLLRFRYQEAKQWIHESAERFPLDRRAVELLFSEGVRLEELGSLEEAREIYSLILSKFLSSPLAAKALFNLGYLSYENEESEAEYRGYFNNLFSLFPTSSAAEEAKEFLASKNEKFLTITAPSVSDPRHPPVLQLKSNQIRKLRFEAYPVNIAQYLQQKKNFQQVEHLRVDLLIPESKHIWEVDLGEQEVPSRIQVPFRTPGVYLVRAFDGELTSTTVLNISPMNVFTRQSGAQFFLLAQNYTTLMPVENAKVTLYRDSHLFFEGKTFSDGGLMLPVPPEAKSISLLVEHGEYTFFQEIQGHFSTTAFPEYPLFAVTDQREYYPGETLHLYGWIKNATPLASAIPASLPVYLLNEKKQIITTHSVEIQSDGFFENEFLLFSAGVPPGEYRLQIKYQNLLQEIPFQVRVPPAFPFHVEIPQRIVSRGQKIEIHLTAPEAELNHPIRVSYQVYRGENQENRPIHLWYSANLLCTSPSTAFSLNTDEIPQDSQLYLILTAKQGNQECSSEHRLWVRTQSKYLTLVYDRDWSYTQEKQEIQIRLQDALGKPISEQGWYQIIQATTEKVFVRDTWKTDDDGKALLPVSLETPGLYRIEILPELPFQNPISSVAQQMIWRVKLAPLQRAEIYLGGKKTFFLEEEQISLRLKSPFEKALGILTIEQHQVLTYQVLQFSQSELSILLPLKPNYQPGIKIHLALAWKEQWIEEEVFCSVSQKLIRGVQLEQFAGNPEQRNALIVQLNPLSSESKLFSILIPSENNPPLLHRERFFQTWFPWSPFQSDKESSLFTQRFSSLPFEPLPAVDFVLDKNSGLQGNAQRLSGEWQESAPFQKKLVFSNPKNTGEYSLYVLAMGPSHFFDFWKSPFLLHIEAKTQIQGPVELFLDDHAEYTLDGNSYEWTSSPELTLLQNSGGKARFKAVQTGPFTITARDPIRQKIYELGGTIQKIEDPVYQVLYGNTPDGVLNIPSNLDWKQSTLILKLWAGIFSETQQVLQRVHQEFEGDILSTVAQLMGELLRIELDDSEKFSLQLLSNLYLQQNSDGSFGPQRLPDSTENTALVLYLFSKMRKYDIAVNLEVCRKALDFLDAHRSPQISNYADLWIEYCLGLHSNILSLPVHPLPKPRNSTDLESLAMIRLIALQRFDYKLAKKALALLKPSVEKWVLSPKNSLWLWKSPYPSLIFVFEALGDFTTTLSQRQALFHWFLSKQTEWGWDHLLTDIHLLFQLISFPPARSPQESEFRLGEHWTQRVQGSLQIPLTTLFPEKIPESIPFRFSEILPFRFRFVIQATAPISKNYRRYISEALLLDPWNQKLLGDRWFFGGNPIERGKTQDHWFVHLHFSLDEEKAHFLLEDFIPAGAEFQEGRLMIGPYQSFYIASNRILFSFQSLAPGEYDILYPILWKTSGKYQIPSPRGIGIPFEGCSRKTFYIEDQHPSDRLTTGAQYAKIDSLATPAEKLSQLDQILSYPLIDFWRRQILLQKMRLLLQNFAPLEAHQIAQTFSSQELSFQDHLYLARSYQTSGNLEQSRAHLLEGLQKCCEREVQLIQTMQQTAEIQRSQNYLLQHVLYHYPELDIILNQYLEICVQQGERALASFIALYAEHPLAEKARQKLIESYKNSGQFEKAITQIRNFLNLFPSHENADRLQYELGYLLYETAQYDEALETMRFFISKNIHSPRLSSQGRFLLGKIYQIKGNYREAVEQLRYTPLHEAQILLEELRSPQLSVPKLLKVSVQKEFVYPIQFRNLKEVSLSIYPLNLIALFEQSPGISRLKEIDLTGVVPLHTETLELHSLPYDSAQFLFPLKSFPPGAYFIQVSNGKLSSSSILLVTNLNTVLSRFGSHFRLHVSEKGESIRRAQVRILQAGAIHRGSTNIQGIWDIQGKDSPDEVLIEHQGEYDYLRGTDEN